MAKIGETLALLGYSKAAINELIANPSTTRSTKEALENKLDKLTGQSDALLQHRRNLKKVVSKLEAEIQRVHRNMRKLERISLIPDALVHFVDVLEVANQYYDFKTTAKEAYDFMPADSSIEISHTLLADKQLRSKFNKLGRMEILQAAHDIFWELRDERYGTDSSNSLKPIDWIYRLVLKTREKGYVMDQDPIAELEKMMKFKPEIYDHYYLMEQIPAKSTENSREEARIKYSQLVSTMHTQYKETCDEKGNTSTRNKESCLKRKFRPNNAEFDRSGLMNRKFATMGDFGKYLESRGYLESSKDLRKYLESKCRGVKGVRTPPNYF